jgi:tripartite-type tricarboxylate transporter receptor subunit TctC
MALAQDYPVKPIHVLTYEAGGGADFVSRLIAQGLAPVLGQPMVVDNRVPLVGTELVMKAPADGYTLLIAGATMWTMPLLKSTSYNAVADFAPIAPLITQPNILVVHPSLPVRSVKELIGLAKAKPGVLNYAATQIGGPNHLAAELFNYMAGVRIVRINYKGTAQALSDVVSGQVQLMFANISTAVPHINANRLRALAVTSAQPSALVPGLPTVGMSGLPGYEAGNINALFAPAKTPDAIVNRLNQEVVRLLNVPEVRQKLLKVGVETIAGSPADLSTMVKSETARLDDVIRSADIHLE